MTPSASFKCVPPAAENKWKMKGMDMLKHYILVELRALLRSKPIAEMMAAHKDAGRQRTNYTIRHRVTTEGIKQILMVPLCM